MVQSNILACSYCDSHVICHDVCCWHQGFIIYFDRCVNEDKKYCQKYLFFKICNAVVRSVLACNFDMQIVQKNEQSQFCCKSGLGSLWSSAGIGFRLYSVAWKKNREKEIIHPEDFYYLSCFTSFLKWYFWCLLLIF